eukprot:COSAG02_NODE_2387_length_8986_cov_12.395184_6_plen_76_part_00
MAMLPALCALAMLQGGAQLPSSLLEAPVPTAPSASCAPGVRALPAPAHLLRLFNSLVLSLPIRLIGIAAARCSPC